MQSSRSRAVIFRAQPPSGPVTDCKIKHHPAIRCLTTLTSPLISQLILSSRLEPLFYPTPYPSGLCVSLLIEEHLLKIEIDIGAEFSLIGFSLYGKYLSHIPLQSPSIGLRTWSAERLPVAVEILVDVQRMNFKAMLALIVMSVDGPRLLGRSWFKAVGVHVTGVDSSSSICHIVGLPSPIEKYCEVFSPVLGKYCGPPAKLHLKENVSPTHRRPRPVPIALLPRVSAGLERMVSEGI